MSEEQLKAFIAKAKDDQSIQEKLKAAKTPDDVVGIAKAVCFVISADEFKTAQSKFLEEELEGVEGDGLVGMGKDLLVLSDHFCWFYGV